jgi:hypothetical protein
VAGDSTCDTRTKEHDAFTTNQFRGADLGVSLGKDAYREPELGIFLGKHTFRAAEIAVFRGNAAIWNSKCVFFPKNGALHLHDGSCGGNIPFDDIEFILRGRIASGHLFHR